VQGEFDLPLPSSAEIKNKWNYTSNLLVYLYVVHRRKLYFHPSLNCAFPGAEVNIPPLHANVNLYTNAQHVSTHDRYIPISRRTASSAPPNTKEAMSSERKTLLPSTAIPRLPRQAYLESYLIACNNVQPTTHENTQKTKALPS
jgi:hypothetical protein